MSTGYHGTKPSRLEKAYIEFVLNPPREPQPHVCGRCRNPWTGRSTIKCPNEKT